MTKEQALGKLQPVEGGFPGSSQMTPFWHSCRPSDYAEHTQDSVAAPLPLTGNTRHNRPISARHLGGWNLRVSREFWLLDEREWVPRWQRPHFLLQNKIAKH